MRYQERKYIRSENSAIRNKDIFNISTSSDFCIFESPTYIMSGVTKIPCNNLMCDFSGTSFSTLLSTAVTNCFTNNDLNLTTCVDTFSWHTKIYEDDVLAYSGTFETTSGLSEVPTDTKLYSGINTGFTTLNYTFTQDESEFTIQRPYGVDELRIDISVDANLLSTCTVTGTSCDCPDGYTATTDNDDCIVTIVTAATDTGVFYTAATTPTDTAYGNIGARFYGDISNLEYPLQPNINTGNPLGTLVDASNDPSPYPADTFNPSGTPVSIITTVNNALWGLGTHPTGRLNNTGIWSSTSVPVNEYIGFSQCIDIVSGGTYHVGMAADNYLRFKVNGELIVILERSVFIWEAFTTWHVFPITLNSGKNIIEMEAARDGTPPHAFSAEIYSASVETLTAATTAGELGLVFTTSGLTGGLFELSTTSGYTCPSGYALDTCVTGTPVCTLIDRVDADECDFSGSCSAETSTLCTQNYDTIASGDTGIYILSGNSSSINFTFDFTGNTSSFNSNNSIFKYEIYKFIPDTNLFNTPAVYVSDDILWSSFSATSATTETIPVADLEIDGDYIIKGYFTHEVCTEFLGLLGETIDSSVNKAGDKFGIYETNKDYYMVAINEAEVPVFNINSDTPVIGELLVNSFISDGAETFFINGQSAKRLILSLNGATLANELDYTFSGNTSGTTTITMNGPVISGDVITYATVPTNTTNSLYTDVFDIDSVIVSGATDGEGSEDVFYNTGTSKYELFTTVTPIEGNDIYVTLNGAVLANGIDYYQSTSNPKRIILEGTIIVGDIITLFYAANISVSGQIFNPNQKIGWSIPTAPINTGGTFTVEIATDEAMTNVVSTAQTSYATSQNSYVSDVLFSGGVGTTLYYRVENEKRYVSTKGDIIYSNAFSDVVPVTLQTNSFNSY